jgi:hypothetical protein
VLTIGKDAKKFLMHAPAKPKIAGPTTPSQQNHKIFHWLKIDIRSKPCPEAFNFEGGNDGE